MQVETIVSVALKTPNGILVSKEAPARHHDLLHGLAALGVGTETRVGSRQGFLTSTGRFVSREEGVAIARGADQIVRKTQPENQLFSEDLW